MDADRAPITRETALDLLRNQNRNAATVASERLIQDPVARMRRPAVAAIIEKAKSLETPSEQLAAFQRVFEIALDEDHVVASAVAMRKLGNPVDHIRKFGFIMRWQIIGPFDYRDGKGFDEVYPPELLSLEHFSGDRSTRSTTKHEGKEGPLDQSAKGKGIVLI